MLKSFHSLSFWEASSNSLSNLDKRKTPASRAEGYGCYAARTSLSLQYDRGIILLVRRATKTWYLQKQYVLQQQQQVDRSIHCLSFGKKPINWVVLWNCLIADSSLTATEQGSTKNTFDRRPACHGSFLQKEKASGMVDGKSIQVYSKDDGEKYLDSPSLLVVVGMQYRSMMQLESG
jgi:hypothetical protein